MGRLPKGVHIVPNTTGKRYEVRVSQGSGADRVEQRRRFDTAAEAKAFLQQASNDAAAHNLTKRNALTVAQACEDWLAGRNVKPTTKRGYQADLDAACEVLGEIAVQDLTKNDVNRLVRSLLDGGGTRKVTATATKPRKPWKGQSVNKMLDRLQAVFTDLQAQGIVRRNPVALVDRQTATKFTYTTLTEAQCQIALDAAAGERFGALWVLALSGLRRGEIAGLRWDDIDFEANVLYAAESTRTTVSGAVIEQAEGKTERSTRALPMPPHVAKALRAARRQQLREQMVAANHYEASGYVFSNPLGRAYHPDSLLTFWRQFCADNGLPEIRLHDARHTCATIMHLKGVPMAVIAQWLGHADSSFTARTYTHSQPEALAAAADLLAPRKKTVLRGYKRTARLA